MNMYILLVVKTLIVLLFAEALIITIRSQYIKRAKRPFTTMDFNNTIVSY